MEGLENDYRLLVNELMRLMLREELFTFVTAKPTDAAQRHDQTGGWDEQRGRANIAWRGPSARDGPHQQDRSTAPAAKRF